MKRWRVGMVGYGWAAGAHIGARHGDRFEVAAVYVAGGDARGGAGAHRRHRRDLRDFGELMARPDIDVIDLCSRSNLHATQAIAAARAGKHLIIEKPISLDLAGLRAVEEAVKARGRAHVRLPPGALLAPVHDDPEHRRRQR